MRGWDYLVCPFTVTWSRELTAFSVMSFVGYDYVKQHGVPPEEGGVEMNGIFGGL